MHSFPLHQPFPGGKSAWKQQPRVALRYQPAKLLISKHLNHNGTSYAGTPVKSRCVLASSSADPDGSLSQRQRGGTRTFRARVSRHSSPRERARFKKKRVSYTRTDHARAPLVRSLTRFPRSLIMLHGGGEPRARKNRWSLGGGRQRNGGYIGGGGGRGARNETGSRQFRHDVCGTVCCTAFNRLPCTADVRR